MPQYEDDLYDDDDQDDFDDSSDLVGKLRRQLRALKKERDTAVAERDALRTSVRERTIAEAVTSAGFPALVGKLIPADVEPEGVGAWLETNGSLFARTGPQEPAGAPPEGDADDTPQTASFFEDAELQAQRAINALGGSGARSADPVAELEARIDGAKSQRELMEILQTAAL